MPGPALVPPLAPSGDDREPAARVPDQVRPSPLTVTLPPAEGRGGRVVQVAGRLDASSAPGLRRVLLALDQECGRGATLVIDLSGVESCDAAGLAPLLLARRRAVSRSYGLALGAPSPAVERTLATHHLTATFTVLVAGQPS